MNIEDHIPLPTRMKYPFNQMNIGDSIAIPKEDFKYAYSSAVNFGVRSGWRFVRRRNKDGSGRIWRSK